MIKALESALLYIEEHYMEQVTLEDLMRASGVSKYSLTRLFKKHFDLPPQRGIWCFRVLVAKQALKYWPELSCREVAFACGFETPAHFCRVFRAMVGDTPQSYKKRFARSPLTCADDEKVFGKLAAIARRAFLSQQSILHRNYRDGESESAKT